MTSVPLAMNTPRASKRKGRGSVFATMGFGATGGHAVLTKMNASLEPP